MDKGTRRETTAREYLLVVAAGLLIAVIAPTSAHGVALGAMVSAVGLFGLAWRLLRGR